MVEEGNAMNYFATIYTILHYLSCATSLSNPDYWPISAEALGVDKGQHNAIFTWLVDESYVAGVEMKIYINSPNPQIFVFHPRITLAGLAYLEDDPHMRKAANISKGIVD